MTAEERLKGSFLLFLLYVWVRVLRLPKPTRVQKDIAEYLEGGPRRRFIAAFRGVGKTFLTGAYVVWRLWKDPNLKVMVVSANERFATKVASFIHVLINAEDAITREPVPWAELRARPGQKNSVLEFEVGPATPSKDPSVFAVGITGQMTGGRADLILSDDVEAPNNSETEAQREKLEDRTGEYAAILKPDGEIIYLGTFQSMQSIYRKLREKGYGMRIWPARYPLKDKEHIYGDALAPLLRADIEAKPELQKPTSSTLGGAPTDPERFSELDLMERESEWGEAGFTLQFMLDTTLSDEGKYPLKTRDLIVMDVPKDVAPVRVAWGSSPDLLLKDYDNLGFDGDRLYRPVYKADEWLPFTGSLMNVDPSGSGSDETAYAVTKFLNGQVYLRKWGGFRDGHSTETLTALAKIAKEEGVNLIRVEGNFGDGMFSRLLEPVLRQIGYAVPVEDYKVATQKEKRIINTLRPALQNHRIVVDTKVVESDLQQVKIAAGQSTSGGAAALEYSGLYQLTHITELRNALRKDDRIDVLAAAVSYWTEMMGIDAAAVERKREEQAAKDFERLLFSSSITGRPTRGRPVRARGRRR